MALHLTPDTMIAAYELLRTTKPFRGWKLPHADEVKFVVSREHNIRGYYERRDGHTIGISSKCIGHVASLMEVMAHEMLHLHQAIAGRETPKTIHNAEFKRIAERICKHHGFDPRAF